MPGVGPPDGFYVVTLPMSASTRFGQHVHPEHQLAWASAGALTVATQDATWVLPPTRALWIPAGLPHDTRASGRALMRSVFVPPGGSPVSWTAPTVVAASPLLAEVITYLGGELPPDRRVHAEVLLADLLTPVPVAALSVRFPDGGLAGPVARALRDDPADQRTLADWGRAVGASERTLARAFAAGTGLPFGRWRTLLRVQAALPLLAAGEAAGRVAARVGYETPSAFTAAFRRETGVTPSAYFGSARPPEQRPRLQRPPEPRPPQPRPADPG
jgi:AraC-like DNA-binding protein/quercetin dioxygenase-like cupin family protein